MSGWKFQDILLDQIVPFELRPKRLAMDFKGTSSKNCALHFRQLTDTSMFDFLSIWMRL